MLCPDIRESVASSCCAEQNAHIRDRLLRFQALIFPRGEISALAISQEYLSGSDAPIRALKGRCFDKLSFFCSTWLVQDARIIIESHWNSTSQILVLFWQSRICEKNYLSLYCIITLNLCCILFQQQSYIRFFSVIAIIIAIDRNEATMTWGKTPIIWWYYVSIFANNLSQYFAKSNCRWQLITTQPHTNFGQIYCLQCHLQNRQSLRLRPSNSMY